MWIHPRIFGARVKPAGHKGPQLIRDPSDHSRKQGRRRNGEREVGDARNVSELRLINQVPTHWEGNCFVFCLCELE